MSLLRPWRSRIAERILARWQLGVQFRPDGFWLCNGWEAYGPFRSARAAERWAHANLGAAPGYWYRLPLWLRVTLSFIAIGGAALFLQGVIVWMVLP